MNQRPIARAGLAVVLILSAAAAAQAGRQHLKRSQHAKPVAARTHAAKPISARIRIEKQASPRECLSRAMYFESNRKAEDGMLAVGTVVVNRLASGRYGATICQVVGQRLQFAPGVMTRTMTEKAPAELARRVADAVLSGERHPVAGGAMFFHTANVPFRTDDKRYLLVSGGNAFYAWKGKAGAQDDATLERAMASAEADRAAARAAVASIAPAIGTPEAAPVTRDALAFAALDRTAAPTKPLAAPTNVAAAPAGPRVITPGAPVLASAGPAFAEAKPASADDAASDPMANVVVAQTWHAFRCAPIAGACG